MRDIKFRGKSLETGEWVYGFYFIEERDIEDGIIWRDIPQIQQRYGDHFQYYDIDPKTIGQYTGRKDKIGWEIYTDDIVRIGSMGGEAGRVIFDTACLAYMVVNSRQWTGAYRLGDFDGSDITIIGNIHDNPELLDVDMSNEIEHEYTDMIVCPWCGHSDRDSWKTEPGLWECDNCKKSYYVERNEEVTYSTQKANYGTCEHCGKEDVPVEGLISHIGMYDSLCPDCVDKEWRRLLKEY